MNSPLENLVITKALKMSKTKPTKFRHFLMLLYRGFLFRKRHYIITFFEIVITVSAVSIPAIIQSEVYGDNSFYLFRAVPDDSYPDNSYHYYSSFDPLKIGIQRDSELYFLYSPTNKEVENFMNETIQFWKKSSGYDGSLEVHSYAQEEDLETAGVGKTQPSRSASVIGTVFNVLDMKKHILDYKIRYGVPWPPRLFNSAFKYEMKYLTLGNAYTSTYFLSWQAAVERTFIKQTMVEKGKNISYQLLMKKFLSPSRKIRRDSTFDSAACAFCYGFLIFIINLVRRVIEEKSKGFKEFLKTMGITELLYWTSTFVNYFAVAAFAVFITCIVYKAPLRDSLVYLEHTDFFLLLFLLLLFMAQLVFVCLAFTTFFSRAVFAIPVLIFVYSVSFLIFFVICIVSEYKYLPLVRKLSICLLPTGFLPTIFVIISEFEAIGEGLRWSNLTDCGPYSHMNLLMVIGMGILSCFIYCIIIWYVDSSWSLKLAIPKSFQFPFTNKFWYKIPSKKMEEMDLFVEEEMNNAFFEDGTSGETPGVVIHNLSKVLGAGPERKLAVNNVSLKMYKDQITVLLGHSGAGKTTIINILAGLQTPSNGTASINGWDIITQTTKAHQNFGVCPQLKVLFDTLTVEEHLKIYAGVKGVPWNKLVSEADDVMKILNLSDKKNELTKNLSDETKRKLCLGIALTGGSSVLFLDEPTSGMKAEIRHSIWEALLDLKHGRTIVVTTNDVEEATVLGERIAILADGEVQCLGSSAFLEHKLGIGYHVHVVKDDNFNLEELTGLLKQYIPDVNIQNDSEDQVTFILPTVCTSCGKIFEDLERNKEALGVSSYSISVTTMEDVFINTDIISDLKNRNEKKILQNRVELGVEGTSMLMMILYGWSSLPLNYLLSLIFKKPKSAFYTIITVNIITGVIVSYILTRIRNNLRREMSYELDVVTWIMRIFPSFALSSGFSNLIAIAHNNAHCETFSPQAYEHHCSIKSGRYDPIFECCKDVCGERCLKQTNPITWHASACGRDILCLALVGCIYFAVLLFVESGVLKAFIRGIKRQRFRLKKIIVGELSGDSYVADSDVLLEESRIENIRRRNSCDETLLVLNLTKVYKDFYAVDHITFGVNKEECLALVGVNGAGKTAVVRMLAGDCFSTDGNATLLQQYSLSSNLEKFQSFIGYCPQSDALIHRLTGREMITLFGRLRGLSGRTLTHSVNNLIAMTDLSQQADKQTKYYSTGNKRKVSVAIAVIGSPPLVLLDEPTVGVDPVSRRKIWTVLSHVRSHSESAIVLTTKSMQESEALSNRLAMMVNGRFQCLGSIEHLKAKFGQGYTIIVKLKDETQNSSQSVTAVKYFMSTNLPNIQLKHDHQRMLHYHLVDSSISLSHLFKFMDEVKLKFDLADYLISNASLDRMFLTFARLQKVKK